MVGQWSEHSAVSLSGIRILSTTCVLWLTTALPLTQLRLEYMKIRAGAQQRLTLTMTIFHTIGGFVNQNANLLLVSINVDL